MSTANQLDTMQRHAEEAQAWIDKLGSGSRRARVSAEDRARDIALSQAVMDLERLVKEVRDLRGIDA